MAYPVFFLLSLCLCQAPVDAPRSQRSFEPPQANDDVRRDMSVVKPDQQYVSLYIPSPLDANDFEELAAVVGLSEQQRALAESFHAAYWSRWQELRESRLVALVRRSGEVGSAGSPVSGDLEAGMARRELLLDCERAFNEVAAIDQEFVGSVEAILSNEQLPSMAVFKDRRSRDRIGTSRLPYTRYGSWFDIAAALKRYDLEALGGQERERFDLLLAEYERKLTALLITHLEQFWRTVQEGAVLTAKRTALQQGPERERLEREGARLRGAAMRTEGRIDELNAFYIDWLGDVLPADVAFELRLDYLCQSFPEAYPNPFEVSVIFDRAAAHCSEAAELRPTVVELRVISAEEQDRLSRQMVDRVRQWMNSLQDGMGYMHADFERYKADLLALQQKRKERSEASLRTLEELLGPARFALIEGDIRNHQRAVQARRPSGEMNLSFRP